MHTGAGACILKHKKAGKGSYIFMYTRNFGKFRNYGRLRRNGVVRVQTA